MTREQRILDLVPKKLISLKGKSLLRSIAAAEGRTVVAEAVVTVPPLIDGCSNLELAASFGADLLLLNQYDVDQPQIAGFPSCLKKIDASIFPEELWANLGWGVEAKEIKELVGRPLGINLEPVSTEIPLTKVSTGRRATVENAFRAQEQGIDFIVITGNPNTMVSLEAIIESVQQIKKALGDNLIVMAGKMHGAGAFRRNKPWITEEEIKMLADAGADVLLLPLPGTVPGIDLDHVCRWIENAHYQGLLVMLTLGTSQEGSTHSVIERLALDGKKAGGDLFHIGDAGFSGIALPELLLTYSIALRGKRHTYRRMSQSLLREG